MIATVTTSPLEPSGPLVLESASWSFYSHLLEEAGADHLRVTYDDGRMEIMSPLPKHGRLGHLVGRLVETMCLERRIDVEGFENTTFRSEAKLKGLEPDKCYYVQRVNASRDIEDEFDPAIHPAPDLAIEVEVSRRLISREPIYAALGVPELWRVTVGEIRCRHLVDGDRYEDRAVSLAFPFLKPADLWPWVGRLRTEPRIPVLGEFQAWARNL